MSGPDPSGQSDGHPDELVFEALFSASPLPALVLSEDGVILRFNRAATDLFATVGLDLRGRNLATLLDTESEKRVRAVLSAPADVAMTERLLVEWSLPAAERVESTELELLPVRLGDGGYRFGAFLVPAAIPAGTGLVQAGKLMARVTRLSETVKSACHALAVAASRDELVRGVADALAQAIADTVVVHLSINGRPYHTVVDRNPSRRALLTSLRPDDCPFVARVTRRASPEVHAGIEDRGLLGKLPDGREVVDALKVTSVAGAPIRTGRQVAGAIVIIQSRPGIHIGFDELGTLTDIADLGGAALTRRWPAVTSG